MTEVTKEIVTLYKVDGIFSNRWAGHGVCYCALLPEAVQGSQRV